MSTGLPITRSTRRVELAAAVGQTLFDFGAPLFDPLDIDVDVSTGGGAFTRLAWPADYAVSIAAGYAYAQIQLTTAPRPLVGSPTATVRLDGRRTHERQTDVTRGGAQHAASLELELDKQTVILQEQRRDIDDAQAADAALDARATALEGRATAVEGRATALEGRATTLEGRADGHDATLADHGGRIGALEVRADAVEPRVTALEGRASAVEGRASALETRVTQNEWRDAALTGRVDGHDQAIAMLAADIAGSPAPSAALYDLIAAGVKARLRHPYAGQWFPVGRSTALSGWAAGLVWLDDADQLLALMAVGTGHTTEAAQIVCRSSEDGGSSWRRLRTVFSRRTSGGYIRSSAFARMGGTRAGGLVTTGVDARRQWFVYSDTPSSQTATWTTVEITASVPLADHFVFGQMMRWPAAAGGHDTDGWMVASYGGDDDFKILRTADNGSTWSDVAAIDGSTLPGGAAQEPAIVQTPEGWIVFVRTPANGNVWAATAPPAMTPWSAWVDTGVPLGANVIDAVVDGGFVHLYTLFREGFPGSVDDNMLHKRSLLTAQAHASPAAFGGVATEIVAALPDRATGYVQRCQAPNGDWFSVWKVREGGSTTDGSGAEWWGCRSRQGPIVQQNAQQLALNPDFALWTHGETFAASSTDRPLADRWRVQCSGSTVTAARVAIPEEVRRATFSRSPWGLQFSGTSDNFIGVYQWLFGDAARRFAALTDDRQRLTVRAAGWRAPPTLRFTMVANSTALITEQTVPAPQGLDGDAPWVTELELRSGLLAAAGLTPGDITSLRFGFGNGSTASAPDFYLSELTFWLGDAPLEAAWVDTAEAVAAARRHAQRLGRGVNTFLGQGVADSVTQITVALAFEQMEAAAFLSTPAPAGDFRLRGLTSAGVVADLTPTAVSFNTGTDGSAKAVFTVPGAPAATAVLGYGYEAWLASGATSATAYVLAATGY